MKKEYIEPTISIMQVKMQTMIAGSGGLRSVLGLDDVSVSDEDYSGGASDSRGGSIWGDD